VDGGNRTSTVAVFRATRLGQLGQVPADASLAESGNHASIDASLAERVGYKADERLAHADSHFIIYVLCKVGEVRTLLHPAERPFYPDVAVLGAHPQCTLPIMDSYHHCHHRCP